MSDGKAVPLQVTSRHLILGPWHGLTNGISETEVDLGFPPGSHLESWASCTLAGAGFLSTRKAGRGKLLLLGLGGGSVASFAGKHWPGVSLEAVEVNSDVVKVAERYFGVSCDPPSPDPLPPPSDNEAPFTADSNTRPVRVRVTSAEKFVKSTLSDPECRYDGILLDLTTRGEFPSPLLTTEFFKSVFGLQKDSSSCCVAVYVFSKGERHSIVQKMKGVFGKVQVLLDPSYDESDQEYEPCVVLGLAAGSKVRLTKEEWISRAKGMREEWEEAAPLMPFELSNVVEVDEESVNVSWGANSLQMESKEETSNVKEDAKVKVEVPLMDKSDPAFDLFD
ncbi:hypothetical protein HDV05_006874 [Chytridiales sp. JEL 0842]|nr:hypothetical protein HDV05_006874 [Chytridiales sp. JEL 0842]